jgi:hypothetical protein
MVNTNKKHLKYWDEEQIGKTVISRKGAKHAKFREIRRYFSLRLGVLAR